MRNEAHTGPLVDSINGFEIIDCQKCRFKHIVPVPTPEMLDEIYRKEYYDNEKPLYISRTKEDQEWWDLVFKDRYDTFEEFLEPSQRRVLDIGSGAGFFLLYGKNRGWNVLGVEPSKQAAEYARNMGLNVIEEFFTEGLSSQIGHFDVVYLSQVLEHVPNPEEILAASYKILNPGGLVCVVVPNDYNPFQVALRNQRDFMPWWVAPPHHINYFDANSITHVVEKAGFETLLKEATFPMDLFLMMGDNYIGNDLLGRQCHGKRKLFETTMAEAGLNSLKRSFYRFLAQENLGRETLIVARKMS